MTYIFDFSTTNHYIMGVKETGLARYCGASPSFLPLCQLADSLTELT